uniref:X-linked retinitis pigmentosa GTPase regulator n=1 Tax=Cyprinus carpio carpio TaxID=630221 RepID=A0A9J7XDD6_CYPCA
MTGETDTEIPETGAVFTFGKSKIANNVPSRLWLKNDIPVHVSCGQSHSAFVTEQGRLFVFGNNNRGQLGLQTKGPVNKPTCVKVLKGERAQFVACGTDHTLVSTSQGEIFAAGGNSDGQLGLGHCNDSISFQRLHPFCDYAPIILLSAGGHTSAALTEDGRLFLWGDNSVGQLGLGNDSHALLPKELKLGQTIQWVSCGYRHSALVTDNGDVFTFGESADGRLGLSAHQLANHNDPQRVESLHGVLQVACGGKHTLALTEDELYSFGRGEFGQLGLGTLMFLADTPVAVGHFRKGRVTHVTCGENHSALITDSGLLYTFGDGRHGKLGLGDENFTNQFTPTVCQRFFDYSVMTVACGSSHMLVFARPRQQESEEVCLEDEDVTYSYLDRCYTSMLQGQPLEHIPDPAPALALQPTFLPSSLPTSHRWSISTRARRRQRESSSAQFGPEFCNLPPPTTGFTALALTGNIFHPRSPTDTPKRFKTEASVESASTSIILPARTTPLTQITNNEEDCHSVGTSENSISDKTHEENKHSGMVENIPQQSPPTKVQAGSVSHSSVTESPPSRNLKNKKPRSGDPKNPAMAEEHSYVTASQSKMQSKTYKKTIQSTKNKSKSQVVEVRLSSDRMSAKEKDGSSETSSTNIDPRDKISKVDKYSKVQHTDSRGQEVTALAEMEKKPKPSPTEIQKTFSRSSPVQEVKQVRTTPTKVQEVKSPKIKEMGIPVGTTKRAKSPVKVQNVPSGTIEVSKVESTPQADAQRDIEASLGKAQEVRSTLINTQELGNSTPVKIPAKMQNTSKKRKEKNDVDTEESSSELKPKKAKKKRSDKETAPMSETAPKTPSPLSVSKPKRISKAKKGKPVESKNSNFQLKHAMPAQEKIEIKRENDSKIPQNSDISFPPIKYQKSVGTAEKSQSASNLQPDQKHSQSLTDKVLTEPKHEFPSIKSLAPERGHSFSSLWSNNQSATNKSSTTKETESSSGKLLSPSSASPQHKQSPLIENKFTRKTVEHKEPDRMPQAEPGIMGSVVSSLPAMGIASAAPLLIKAAEVLSETQPEPSIEMSSHVSVSKDTSGSNILLEQEVDQDSTVQDVSAIKERDGRIIRQQSAQDQNDLVSNENEMSGDGKIEEEEHVKYTETEREEEGCEEESLVEEEDELEEVGQEEENNAVEDEEERESKNYEDRGESAQQGEEESEEERSEAAREEEDDCNSGQSSKSEGEMSKGEESGDETEREEGEQSEGQEKEESEDGETDEKEEEDEESGGEDKEDERESWDEGSEREVEEEEKTDAKEEQEGESSNEEKTDEQSESDNDQKNERSDEEEAESEEKDESKEEEEENETVEGEGGQEEKGEEGSEEEDEVGNEDEDENQEEESDHEEEDESRNQAKEEEEEEENNEEEEGEEDKEEEVDEEENNEELKDKKDGVTNKSEEEESVREKEERQNEVEAEDEEKMSETDGDGEKQEGDQQIEEEDGEKEENKKEGEMDTGEEKFREEENLDILEKQETERGDEDDETDKLNEMEEENNEEEGGHEEEAEEEEIDQKEENKTTERSQRKQRETNEEEKEGGEEAEEEEEEEAEQKNKNIKTEKNRRKSRETSEEEEEQEEESEEEEEESEQEEKNIKLESSEEEEEIEEEEEESEQEEKNIKLEKNRRKPRETSEEEEEQEEESEEEEEEEEIEQKEKNIELESSEEEEEQSEGDEEEEEEEETERKEENIKNKRKQRETSEEEEEQEEETEEEEEEGEEQEAEEEEEGEEEEQEEENTKKVPKQKAKPDALPPRRQTNAQRDRQKTRQRHQQNVKGKKQTASGAQDPQFWNNVLPQYLNLK